MKFYIFLLFVLTALWNQSLAAEKLKLGEYESVPKTPQGSTSGLSQDYQLEKDNGMTPLEFDDIEKSPELDPQRVCLVVRCFPKGAKYQVCWCIKSRK